MHNNGVNSFLHCLKWIYLLNIHGATFQDIVGVLTYIQFRMILTSHNHTREHSNKPSKFLSNTSQDFLFYFYILSFHFDIYFSMCDEIMWKQQIITHFWQVDIKMNNSRVYNSLPYIFADFMRHNWKWQAAFIKYYFKSLYLKSIM